MQTAQCGGQACVGKESDQPVGRQELAELVQVANEYLKGLGGGAIGRGLILKALINKHACDGDQMSVAVVRGSQVEALDTATHQVLGHLRDVTSCDEAARMASALHCFAVEAFPGLKEETVEFYTNMLWECVAEREHTAMVDGQWLEGNASAAA